MPDEPLGPILRREIRRKRFGPLAQCTSCGERDPLLLQQTSVGIECSRCEAVRMSGKPTEAHHPAGRANSSLAVILDANLHALFTDAQYDWPLETLVNRDRRPARRLAALIRALIDFARIALPLLLDDLEELVEWLEANDLDLERKPK